MAKISIVSPVYGVERYIHQFLDSIRHQTFQDFEIILVDDGSKDRCPEILDAFAAEDARCRVIHQENAGVSAARNAGLKHVTGEYIYIVDSDDWLEPTALEVMWQEAEKTGADLIYGDWVSERKDASVTISCFPKAFVTTDPDTIRALQYAVNNNNRVTISRPEFHEIRHLGGAPWRGMMKASIIREHHLRFDPYVRGLGDDILFMLQVYEYLKKVAYVPEVIYHYRKLDMSYSHGFKANYLETVQRIFEKQEEFLKTYKKDELAWESYYTRVLIYLQQGMERYFKNEDNPRSPKESYREFKQLIKTSPYREAIRKASVRYMGRRKPKYTTLMLRFGMVKVYWNVFR